MSASKPSADALDDAAARAIERLSRLRSWAAERRPLDVQIGLHSLIALDVERIGLALLVATKGGSS